MEETSQTQGQSGNGSMMKIAVVIVIVVVIAAGGFLLMSKKSSSTPAKPETMQGPTSVPSTQAVTEGTKPATSGAGMMTDKEKTFTVEAANFSFTPAEIRVKKGDTVNIAFTNKMGIHDFVIDEFHVKTKQISAGQIEQVTFVADKAGTFEYYCSVGKHRQMGMVGKLIVE